MRSSNFWVSPELSSSGKSDIHRLNASTRCVDRGDLAQIQGAREKAGRSLSPPVVPVGRVAPANNPLLTSKLLSGFAEKRVISGESCDHWIAFTLDLRVVH